MLQWFNKHVQGVCFNTRTHTFEKEKSSSSSFITNPPKNLPFPTENSYLQPKRTAEGEERKGGTHEDATTNASTPTYQRRLAPRVSGKVNEVVMLPENVGEN